LEDGEFLGALNFLLCFVSPTGKRIGWLDTSKLNKKLQNEEEVSTEPLQSHSCVLREIESEGQV